MSKKKKEKTKITKKGKRRLILFILILIAAGILIFMAIKPNNSQKEVKGKKVVDKIDNFDYTVSETDTKLFKSEFKKLKSVLSEKKVDNKEYSQSVAKLFIIDFFTLNNKMTKNDVGGVQFVYSNYKTTFIDKARDQFYKYVKSNLDGNRNQSLPEVSDINIDACEEVSASAVLSGDQFNSIEEAYNINLSWSYKEDLGYQSSANIIVVKDGDKFAVAKMNAQ